MNSKDHDVCSMRSIDYIIYSNYGDAYYMHSFMKRWEKEDNLDKTSYMYFIGHLIRAPFPQKIDKKKKKLYVYGS